MWDINASCSRSPMKKDQKKKQYLFVCHGKDCIKRDSKDVQRALEKELKSTEGKLNYEIVKTRCMDRCKEGPSIIVNNVFHGSVGLKDLAKLLNKNAVK